MEESWPVSPECIERLEAWVLAHYPAAFEDPRREFFRGLLFICEEEVRVAVARERRRALERLGEPGSQ